MLVILAYRSLCSPFSSFICLALGIHITMHKKRQSFRIVGFKSSKQELENRKVPIFNSILVLFRQDATVQVFVLLKFFLHIMGSAKALKNKISH